MSYVPTTVESVPRLLASNSTTPITTVPTITDVIVTALTTAVPRFVGDIKTMFQWGDSGVINVDWDPPTGILGFTNTPKSSLHLGTALIIMMCMWFMLTLSLKRLWPHRTDAYISRVVSLIHCVGSFILSFYCCYLRFRQVGGGWAYVRTFTCLAEPPLADEQYNGLFSGSYFLMDTFGIIFGSYFDPMFIVHHAAAIIAILGGLFTGSIGPEMAAGLFLLEGSNPLMHTRWLLQAEKIDIHHPDSCAWQFVNKGFYVMFFLMRQVLGSLSAYNFTLCAWVPWYTRIIGVGYWAFSLKFLIDIIKKDRAGERWMQ